MIVKHQTYSLPMKVVEWRGKHDPTRENNEKSSKL